MLQILSVFKKVQFSFNTPIFCSVYNECIAVRKLALWNETVNTMSVSPLIRSSQIWENIIFTVVKITL
jgi:hypothetical protein